VRSICARGARSSFSFSGIAAICALRYVCTPSPCYNHYDPGSNSWRQLCLDALVETSSELARLPRCAGIPWRLYHMLFQSGCRACPCDRVLIAYCLFVVHVEACFGASQMSTDSRVSQCLWRLAPNTVGSLGVQWQSCVECACGHGKPDLMSVDAVFVEVNNCCRNDARWIVWLPVVAVPAVIGQCLLLACEDLTWQPNAPSDLVQLDVLL
jgi:hypothetical protein